MKLSHEEVISACKEWMAKHHGLIASKVDPIVSCDLATHARWVNIEFPGIEPREDPPETPYR